MATSQPISPAQFALAINSLPLSTLALKAAEIRNSIAHLDYSNEQLLPFTQTEPPDADCVDAIKENEIVIKRMLERIDLLKKEVEERGVRWEELSGEVVKEETEVDGYGRGTAEDRGSSANRDHNNEERREGQGGSNPWTDGTFTTGRIVNGEVRMDNVGTSNTNGERQSEVNGVARNGVNGTASSGAAATGGSLDDDALRRAMEERMRNLGQDDDDDGMHL